MNRQYGVLLLFVVAATLLLLNPSKSVYSGYPVRWTSPALLNRTSPALLNRTHQASSVLTRTHQASPDLTRTHQASPALTRTNRQIQGSDTDPGRKTDITETKLLNSLPMAVNNKGTSVGLKSAPQKAQNHHHKRHRGKKRKKTPYDKYKPNEKAAKKKFLSDQAVVRSIPVETSGWVYNKTAAELFRKQIVANVSHQFEDGNFWITQKNTPLNTTMQARLAKIKVSTSVFNRFPKKSPFSTTRYKTCSIVGNGGILIGSGCGNEIDSSEFVFRCNMAPMSKVYLKDIGTKTSLVTMNPSMLEYRYKFGKIWSKPKKGRERTNELRNALVQDLSAYGDSYVWIGSFFSRTYDYVFEDVLREKKARQKLAIAHPDFVRSMHAFWKEHGLRGKRASTGMILVSTAMQMCEELHLYGYWPFHSDRESRRLTEHYFDNVFPTAFHKVPDEFRQLQHLHNTGVLRLTTRACQ